MTRHVPPTLESCLEGRRRALLYATDRVPGVRRLPVLKLLLAAELALLAHEHVARLTHSERRRVLTLIGHGRGRRRNLSPVERDELAALIARMEPRMLFGRTVDTLSPGAASGAASVWPQEPRPSSGQGHDRQPVRRPTALEWSRRKIATEPPGGTREHDQVAAELTLSVGQRPLHRAGQHRETGRPSTTRRARSRSSSAASINVVVPAAHPERAAPTGMLELGHSGDGQCRAVADRQLRGGSDGVVSLGTAVADDEHMPVRHTRQDKSHNRSVLSIMMHGSDERRPSEAQRP